MNDIEFINETNDSPFYAIIVGSFDLLSGIKLGYSWTFQKDDDALENFENTLKITLASVHRQSEEYFANVSTSIIDIQNLKWLATNAVFLINPSNSPQKSKFVSVIFILKSILVRNDFHLRNSLLLLTRKFAQNVKNCYANNQPLSSLREFVDIIVYRGSCLIQSGIPNSYYVLNKDFKLLPNDFLFYAILLTSHIQTKMTTVIETSTLSDALPIVSFLINFMLPFQIGQSSIQHILKPVPGLYLQIVENIKQPMSEIRNFSGPVTWVRLFEKKRKIYQFLSTSKFKPTSNTTPPPFENFEIFPDNTDIKSTTANWSLATCQLLLNSQSKTESKIICEQQFSELNMRALSFLLTENKKGERDLFKKIMEINDQDEKLLTSISQIIQINNATD